MSTSVINEDKLILLLTRVSELIKLNACINRFDKHTFRCVAIDLTKNIIFTGKLDERWVLIK